MALFTPEAHASSDGDSRDGLKVHTKEEAAEILRVKVSWLERRAAARQVPFTMLGGAYRFTGAHLSEIVRLNEQGALATAPVPRRRRRQRAGSSTVGHPTGVAPLRPRRPKAVKTETA